MGFVSDVLTSIGGATVILWAFSTFLGKLWADRIARQTIHKFGVEIQTLKSSSEAALEQVRMLNQLTLEERQSFHHISQKTYQDFFEKRLSAYKEILALQHKYVTEVGEDFLVDEFEVWGDKYLRHYKALNNLIGDNQLYISASLDEKFDQLRSEHNRIYKKNELELAYVHDSPENCEHSSHLNNNLHEATRELYMKFAEQLTMDVKSLRSRIDLDKV